MPGLTSTVPLAATVLSILSVAACAASEPDAPADHRAETVARLERMTSGCGLPSGTLALVGTDEVTIAVAPDAAYKKVDCLLEALRRMKPRLKLGFIGNEAYGLENQQ